jgi:signal transduction histidine kinase
VTLAIRSRVALWYAAILGILLTVFAGGLYLVHSRSRLARVDEDLARAGALLRGLVDKDLEEGLGLGQASSDALEDIAMPGRSLAIFDESGALLSGSWPRLPAGQPQPSGRGRVRASSTRPPGTFVSTGRASDAGATFQVGVAESLAPVETELRPLRRTMIGWVSSWPCPRGRGRVVDRARRAAAGETMAAEARRITERTLGSRLRSPNPGDELGQLARAFNDLLSRLESALAQQRQFMADASHELRTPVSIARTAIDVTLGRGGRPEAEYRDSLLVVREQMRRLTRIVDDLFTLARADATGLPLDRRPLYLDELVADCVKQTRVLADPKGVALDWAGPGELEIGGDEALLRQMLGNLLDNAVRHTPSGGQIRGPRRPADEVELAVTDTGNGIAAADRERVFASSSSWRGRGWRAREPASASRSLGPSPKPTEGPSPSAAVTPAGARSSQRCRGASTAARASRNGPPRHLPFIRARLPWLPGAPEGRPR